MIPRQLTDTVETWFWANGFNTSEQIHHWLDNESSKQLANELVSDLGDRPGVLLSDWAQAIRCLSVDRGWLES